MIGVCVLVYAVTLWFCFSAMGRVRKLTNAVRTQAQVVKQHLADPNPVADVPVRFSSGEILNRIRSTWARAPEVPERTLPPGILQPQDEGSE